MKSITTIFLLLITSLWPAWSQQDNARMGGIPGETLYVHQNTQLIFSGEHLYYKAYCRNAQGNNWSPVSKMAYVGLLNRNRETVLLQKVRLENGRGSGDFFIPAELPTGSYKLIGFTEWMKNNPQAPVFLSDVMLINPYLPTPGSYLPEVADDSTGLDSIPAKEVPAVSGTGDPALQAALDRETYGKRERVTWTLSEADADAADGHYSISVRQIPAVTTPDPTHADRDMPSVSTPLARNTEANPVLPEMRGELLSGTVRSPSDTTSVRNLEVALSIPGDNFVFELARTDSQGRFYFNLAGSYEPDQGILQVLHDSAGNFEIAMDPVTPLLPQSLPFYDFQLNPEMEAEIRERSIANQIENAYVEIKPDTILPPLEKKPFYREFQLQFTLDDYTRFNTIQETLVEVVDHVWLATDAGGDPLFQVRPFDGYLDGIGMAPMVFMDGLYIQNHQDIVHYPARQIKTIFISRDRYQVGASVFQGILAFETFASDYSDSFFRDFLTPYPLFKPQPPKAYFFQAYTQGNTDSRIPDFRRQLFWDPDIQLSGSGSSLYWYTSDIPGTYRIRLEGFTASGKPVSYEQDFNVE